MYRRKEVILIVINYELNDEGKNITPEIRSTEPHQSKFDGTFIGDHSSLRYALQEKINKSPFRRCAY